MITSYKKYSRLSPTTTGKLLCTVPVQYSSTAVLRVAWPTEAASRAVVGLVPSHDDGGRRPSYPYSTYHPCYDDAWRRYCTLWPFVWTVVVVSGVRYAGSVCGCVLSLLLRRTPATRCLRNNLSKATSNIQYCTEYGTVNLFRLI